MGRLARWCCCAGAPGTDTQAGQSEESLALSCLGCCGRQVWAPWSVRTRGRHHQVLPQHVHNKAAQPVALAVQQAKHGGAALLPRLLRRAICRRGWRGPAAQAQRGTQRHRLLDTRVDKLAQVGLGAGRQHRSAAKALVCKLHDPAGQGWHGGAGGRVWGLQGLGLEEGGENVDTRSPGRHGVGSAADAPPRLALPAVAPRLNPMPSPDLAPQPQNACSVPAPCWPAHLTRNMLSGLKTPQPMAFSAPSHTSTTSPALGAGRPTTRSTAPEYTCRLGARGRPKQVSHQVAGTAQCRSRRAGSSSEEMRQSMQARVGMQGSSGTCRWQMRRTIGEGASPVNSLLLPPLSTTRGSGRASALPLSAAGR